MSKVLAYVERTFWGVGGLAVGLILLFALLHMLKQNAITGGAASWVGAHSSNY